MILYTTSVHLMNVKVIILKCLQELPYAYAEKCYNGRSDIYITSAQRVRFRVKVLTEKNGPMEVSGERWRAFALGNLNRDVNILHFVEEGDDCFYVTGYNQDGTEFGGYNMIARRFSRFQSRVFDFYDLCQVLDIDNYRGVTSMCNFVSQRMFNFYVVLRLVLKIICRHYLLHSWMD